MRSKRGKGLALGCEPLERRLRQFVEETAPEVVAGLAMEHARLRMGQLEAPALAGEGHVHQATLFLQSVALAGRVLVREQALFHAADEHTIKLQPLAGV